MAEPQEPTPQQRQEQMHALHWAIATRLHENLTSPAQSRISNIELYALAQWLDNASPSKAGSEDDYQKLITTGATYAAEPEKEARLITRFIRHKLADMETDPELFDSKVSDLGQLVDKTRVHGVAFETPLSLGLDGQLEERMKGKQKAPLPPVPEIIPAAHVTTSKEKLAAQITLITQQLQKELERGKDGAISEQATAALLTALGEKISYEDSLNIQQKFEKSLRYADPEIRRRAFVSIMRDALEAAESTPHPEHDASTALQLQRWMSKHLGSNDQTPALAAELHHHTTRPPAPEYPADSKTIDFHKKLQAIETVLSRMLNDNLTRDQAQQVPLSRIRDLTSSFARLTHGNTEDYITGRLDETTKYTNDHDRLIAVTGILREQIEATVQVPSDQISMRELNEMERQINTDFAALLRGGTFAQAVEKEMASPHEPEPVIPVSEKAQVITPAQRLEVIESHVIQWASSKAQDPENGTRELLSLSSNLQTALPKDMQGAFATKIKDARDLHYNDDDTRRSLLIAISETLIELKEKKLSTAEVLQVQNAAFFAGVTEREIQEEYAKPGKLPPLPDKPAPEAPIAVIDRLNALNRIVASRLESEQKAPKLSIEELQSLADRVTAQTPGVEGVKLRAELQAIYPMPDSQDAKTATISVIRRSMQHIVDRADAISSSTAMQIQDDIFETLNPQGGMQAGSANVLSVSEISPSKMPLIPRGIDMSQYPIAPEDISILGISEAINRLSVELTGSSGQQFPLPGTPQPDGQPRIITYSFAGTDFEKRYGPEAEVALTSPEAQAAMRQAMDDIEKIANVRFIPEKPGEEAKANIQFGMAEMPEHAGYADTTPGGNTSVIILRSEVEQHPDQLGRGQRLYSLLVHELAHALTLSHPGEYAPEEAPLGGSKAGGGNGNNPKYSTRSTVMSYNEMTKVRGLSPYDASTLINRFGMAKGEAHDQTIDIHEAHKEPLLFAPGKTVSLDLRDPSLSGELHIDQSARIFADQINGNLSSSHSGLYTLDNRVMPGTRANVIADDTTQVTLGLRGSKDAHLTGGAGNDTLSAFGGNNLLRGGAGADMFMFGADSGTNNTIADFNPAQDRIIVRRGIETIDLAPTDREGGGTIMSLRKEGREVASVFIKSARPEDVEKQITIISSEILPTITHAAPAQALKTTPLTLGEMLNAGLNKLAELAHFPMQEVVEPSKFKPGPPIPPAPNPSVKHER